LNRLKKRSTQKFGELHILSTWLLIASMILWQQHPSPCSTISNVGLKTFAASTFLTDYCYFYYEMISFIWCLKQKLCFNGQRVTLMNQPSQIPAYLHWIDNPCSTFIRNSFYCFRWCCRFVDPLYSTCTDSGKSVLFYLKCSFYLNIMIHFASMDCFEVLWM